MLKKSITYEDYNGKSITEDFYFNMTKAELIEMEVSEKGGLAKKMQDIIAEEDGARIIGLFKQIILASYGIKSEDGKRFIKSEDLRQAFVQTEAYSELFMELSTNAKAAGEFVNGIIPANMAAEVAQVSEELQEKIKDPTLMSKEELLELLNKKSA